MTQTETIPEITIHTRCRLAREHAELTQEQLGDAIDVSERTISRYESGAVQPRRIVLKQWALRCGVSYEWLRGDSFPQVPGGNENGSDQGERPSRWKGKAAA